MQNDKIVLCTGAYDGNIAIWDIHTHRVVKTLSTPSKQLPNRLTVSTDKTQLAAALTFSVKLYDLSSPSIPLKHSFDGFSGNVMAVGFEREKRWLYCCSEDGTARIMDPRKSGFARIFKEKGQMTSAILNQKDNELITGDQQGNIWTFDLIGDSIRKTSLDKAITSLCMTKDGKLLLASTAQGEIQIFRKESGTFKPHKVCKVHQDFILRIVMSPDQKSIATCSADKTIRLLALSEEGSKLEVRKSLIGHTKWVWDAAFNDESDYLVSCSSDTTVKIWHIEQGEARKNIQSQKLAVVCMAFNDSIIRR